MELTENPQLNLAYDFVQYTNKNIFLTGKAGTGKTTFLQRIKQNSMKRMVVVAPTGVAAINAGGVTIHSFFQLPFGPFISPKYNNKSIESPGSRDFNQKISREKIDIIKSLDLLVIDEISMVRADLLDGIDDVLRRFRYRHLPFGGVQLLMIGDIQQLAPVIKPDEWDILRGVYDTIYFFSSKALRETPYVSIELKHIFRQSDKHFVEILNKVRENKIDETTLFELNKRFIPAVANDAPEGYITLTTHNYQAQGINDSKLQKIDNASFEFVAEIQGEFPEYMYPTEHNLVLKEGAQVMFVKNDISRDKLYYNGKIGIIESIEDDNILVKCEGDLVPIPVSKGEWENSKYTINKETKEIEESIVGMFKQFPLKLAWAITIHKSQGLTFEKAIIDANASFAHGQVYVALSRCKTLEGLVLRSRISQSSIKCDSTVTDFSKGVENNPPDESALLKSKIDYQQSLIKELFDFQTLQRRINFCNKLYHDNASSVHQGFIDTINKIIPPFNSEIVDVAAKFMYWIQQNSNPTISIEENPTVQNRLKDASKYFHEKIETNINSELQNFELICDNKAVKKHFEDALLRILEESILKRECFLICQQGFAVKQFLETKAKASIEKPHLKKPEKTSSREEPNVTKHSQLFSMLRKWRDNKAGELNVEGSDIIHYKTILELSNNLPVSIKELKDIHGIGKKKLTTFGQELIEIVRNYCKANNIDKPYDNVIEIIEEQETKAPKIKTQQISFDMFASGKTIEEIASERGFTTGTIEGHLALYVGNGAIPATKLIAEDKLNAITDCMEKNPKATHGEIKIVLGDAYSYGELKIVQQHLEYLQKNKND